MPRTFTVTIQMPDNHPSDPADISTEESLIANAISSEPHFASATDIKVEAATTAV